jgi:peroxiredoxin
MHLDGRQFSHSRAVEPCAPQTLTVVKAARPRPAQIGREPDLHEGIMAELLQATSAAPDFTLRATLDQTLSLSEFSGRPVIFAFYPADWSPVCGDRMVLYNQVLPQFTRYGAALLGISVDGAWCHQAYREHRHLHLPLLADFEPKARLRTPAALTDKRTACASVRCLCALFVIDGGGKVFWS